MNWVSRIHQWCTQMHSNFIRHSYPASMLSHHFQPYVLLQKYPYTNCTKQDLTQALVQIQYDRVTLKVLLERVSWLVVSHAHDTPAHAHSASARPSNHRLSYQSRSELLRMCRASRLLKRQTSRAWHAESSSVTSDWLTVSELVSLARLWRSQHCWSLFLHPDSERTEPAKLSRHHRAYVSGPRPVNRTQRLPTVHFLSFFNMNLSSFEDYSLVQKHSSAFNNVQILIMKKC